MYTVISIHARGNVGIARRSGIWEHKIKGGRRSITAEDRGKCNNIRWGDIIENAHEERNVVSLFGPWLLLLEKSGMWVSLLLYAVCDSQVQIIQAAC